MSPFCEPSLAWFEASETALRLLKTKVSGLAPNASLSFHPSVETALVEWALLLLDRNREMGSGRTGAVIESGDDPCLRFAGQVVSSQSLAVSDLATGTVAAASCLFVAFCDDDRFEAMERDGSDREKALSEAAWSRVPLIRVRQMPLRDLQVLKPRPYEIKILRLADGSAVSILGDRLRLVPRFSQHAFQSAALQSSVRAFAALMAESTELHNFDIAISVLSAALPPDWRILEPASGGLRVSNRLVLVTEIHDSSWVAEQLAKAFPSLRIGCELWPLSGCDMNDERLQEWLRARSAAQLKTPLEIRGALQIDVSALFAALGGADATAKGTAFASVLKAVGAG